METLVLKPLQHKQEENIGMYFPNLAVLNKAVRKIKNARWTATHKCWYVPLHKDDHDEIVKALQALNNLNYEMIFFQRELFECHWRNLQFKKRNTFIMYINELEFS